MQAASVVSKGINNPHVHAFRLRKEPILGLRGSQRSDDLVELAIAAPAVPIVDMVDIRDFTLVDLGTVKLFRAQELAKTLPLTLKLITQVRISWVRFIACELAPVADEAVALDLEESITRAV